MLYRIEVYKSKNEINEKVLFLFLFQCMVAYVEFEIMEGAYEISCPDALCPAQGILALDEITKLSSSSLIDKHNRYRLNRGTLQNSVFFSFLLNEFMFLGKFNFNRGK